LVLDVYLATLRKGRRAALTPGHPSMPERERERESDGRWCFGRVRATSHHVTPNLTLVLAPDATRTIRAIPIGASQVFLVAISASAERTLALSASARRPAESSRRLRSDIRATAA